MTHRLTLARLRANLTTHEAARLLDLTHGELEHMEQEPVLAAEDAKRFAEVYGVRAEWVMGEVDLHARRAEIEDELRAIDAALAVSECPGEGRCHGCLGWCDRCGDVGKVCDATVCHKHRCIECGEIRPPETRDFWSYVCDVCDQPLAPSLPRGKARRV